MSHPAVRALFGIIGAVVFIMGLAGLTGAVQLNTFAPVPTGCGQVSLSTCAGILLTPPIVTVSGSTATITMGGQALPGLGMTVVTATLCISAFGPCPANTTLAVPPSVNVTHNLTTTSGTFSTSAFVYKMPVSTNWYVVSGAVGYYGGAIFKAVSPVVHFFAPSSNGSTAPPPTGCTGTLYPCPTAVPSFTVSTAGLSVSLTDTSQVPQGTTGSISLAWGDGTPASAGHLGSGLSHQYLKAGTYAITDTVTDTSSGGQPSVASVTMNVTVGQAGQSNGNGSSSSSSQSTPSPTTGGLHLTVLVGLFLGLGVGLMALAAIGRPDWGLLALGVATGLGLLAGFLG